MKQVLLTLLVIVITTGMITAQEKELVILHTNDTHGRIFPVIVKDNNATSQMVVCSGALHRYSELSKGKSVENTNKEITQLAKQYIKDKKEISAPEVTVTVKN